MSDATTDDAGAATLSWERAAVLAVLVTAACVAFALGFAAVADLLADL